MGTQRENVEINLRIQGIEDFKSFRDLNSQLIAQRNSVSRMDRTDPGYAQAITRLRELVDLQSEWRAQINGTQNEAKGLRKAWEQIKTIAAGFSLGELVSKGISRAVDFIKEGIVKMKDAYAEAEKNRSVLTNAFKGDEKQAAESMKMLMAFAAKTPEGLQEATEGYLKLVNRGIIPAREEMVKIGDVAASQRKSMDQYIEAILDAQTGENERLKELGIRAVKNGDTVSFSFKGITKEVKNTEDAIYKALVGFGAMEGVKGTMDVISEGIIGLESNISDTTDQIYTKLGQSTEGFIHGFYKAYSSVLSYINEVILSTETKAQRLTTAFKEQAAEVVSLERNILPLADRYEELQKKGKLNNQEQVELKNILAQVNATFPSAITNWNHLGEAIGMNTDKVREYVKMQGVLMKNQNKDAISEAKKELETYLKVRAGYVKELNDGQTSTISGGGYVFTTKNSDKKIREIQKEIDKYNNLIEERQLLIKGLSGDYIDEIKNPKAKTGDSVSTARTEGVINKEIAALKDLRKETDIHSKAYAEYTAKIKKLDDELAAAQGKSTSNSKQLDSDKKKAITEALKLDAEYKKLGIDRLNNLLSDNEKEVELVKQKYQKLIDEEKAFLNLKGITADQKKAREEQISSLETQRDQAAADARKRIEEEMALAIFNLRASLSKSLETELGKEKIQINKFYDDQIQKNAGNGDLIAKINASRAEDLTNAELREKQRLIDEKKKMEVVGDSDLENTHAGRLAKINQQYDAEIEALKAKYSAEGQLTQEYQDLLDKISGNRRSEIANEEKAENAKRFDYAIQGAETLNNTVASMAANNRRSESDRKLKSLDDQREKELSNANLTEEQKKAINEKFDAKVRAEKLRAWRADQNAAAKQAFIGGLLGAAKAMPNLVLAAIALGTGIANAAVIKAQKPPEFKKGVMLNSRGGIPDGPSHDEGGINLINNKTGEIIGEMEGGEPIMVLSKETSKNNAKLINELLFNSQFRNGAKVSVNSDMASQAIRPYKTGGYVQDNANAPQNTFSAQTVMSTKSLEDKLDEKFDQLIEKWDLGIPFDYRTDVEYRNRISAIKARVNAK